MACALVARGVGVGLTSLIFAKKILSGQVRAIPFEPKTSVELVALYLKAKSPVGPARRFVEAMRGALNDP